jgi:hypothetical protein
MKKTVLKTVGFTLLGVILTLAIFFGVFFFVAPGILGNASKELGNHGAAVYFYEKQYGISGDFGDLSRLVYELDPYEDAELTEEYTTIVLEDFDEYFAVRSSDFESVLSAKEYFYNKCVVAMVENGNLDGALSKANDFVLDEDCGYTTFNPFRIIISTKASGMTSQELLKIKAKLTTLQSSGVGGTLIATDISELNQLLLNA